MLHGLRAHCNAVLTKAANESPGRSPQSCHRLRFWSLALPLPLPLLLFLFLFLPSPLPSSSLSRARSLSLFLGTSAIFSRARARSFYPRPISSLAATLPRNDRCTFRSDVPLLGRCHTCPHRCCSASPRAHCAHFPPHPLFPAGSRPACSSTRVILLLWPSGNVPWQLGGNINIAVGGGSPLAPLHGSCSLALAAGVGAFRPAVAV